MFSTGFEWIHHVFDWFSNGLIMFSTGFRTG